MEGVRRESFSSPKIFIKNSKTFEEELKQKLKRSRQDWVEAGEADTRLHRLCNSMHFWKKKLQPALEDKSLIITLFNEANNVRVELLDIITAIEGLDDTFIVKGIANFRNPRYVCLYFDSKHIRDKVKEKFRILNNDYVIFLSWALKSEPSSVRLSVHWMPLTIDTEIIKKKLDQYVNFIEEEKIKMKLLSGREMPTAKIEFKINFKKDFTAEQIPHVMNINNMEALITINGRSPLCLSCDRLGHISRDCDSKFCYTCRAVKKKAHLCESKSAVKSYADILKADNLAEPDLDPDVEQEVEVVVGKLPLNREHLVIEQKIKIIEGQLKDSKEQRSILESDDSQNKRKVHVLMTGENCLSDAAPLSGDWAEEEESKSDSSMEFYGEEDDEAGLEDTDKAMNSCELKSGAVSKDNGKMHINEGQSKRKKKIHKRKSEEGSTDIKSDELYVKGKKTVLGQPMALRSYGRPIPNNPRKIKQEEKWNKLSEKREFVFED